MTIARWQRLFDEIDLLCQEVDRGLEQQPEWRKLNALRSLIAATGGEVVTHPLGGGRVVSTGGRDVGQLARVKRLDVQEVIAAWRVAGGAGLAPASIEDPTPLEVRATVEMALAGAGARPALLLFTVASVQEFVTSARRTQDLWFGSYLFSYLMWRAMQAIGQRVGYDVFLLPTLQRQPLLLRALGEATRPEELVVANLPNIFTALLPAVQAEDLARRAEAAVWEARDEIFRSVKRAVERAAHKAGAGALGSQWDDTWARQRRQFLQANVFWAIMPLPEPGDYARASIDGGFLLSARKTLRQFFQEGEPDGSEKCTLCGIRAAVHPEGHGGYGRLRAFCESIAKVEGDDRNDIPKLAGRLRRGDRLCAVCLTKRLALQVHFTGALELNYHLFPSTASVAAAPFVERLLSSDVHLADAHAFAGRAIRFLRNERIHHPANPLPKLAARHSHPPPAGGATGPEARERLAARHCPLLELDGQWLYPESWTPAAIAGEMGVRPGDLLREAAAVEAMPSAARSRSTRRIDRHELDGIREQLSDLLRQVRATGIRPPSRYFAVVALDGDQMGDWIGGRKGMPLTPKYHVALAVALRNFALRLASIAVESESPAKLIYAGGDDVLALLPVESVISVLRALRAFFRGDMPADGRDAVPSGWSVGNGFVTEPDGTAHLVMGPHADFSAAVVFVHHSHPLSHAVEEAHHVLKVYAKERLGRSSVAFRLMKRSGEPFTTGLKWALPPGPPAQDARTESRDLLQLVQQLVEATANKGLSPSLSHDMRREGHGVQALPVDVQEKLLRYVVERRPEGGSSSDLVVDLFTSISAGGGAPVDPWRQTADVLEVVRFLAGARPD